MSNTSVENDTETFFSRWVGAPLIVLIKLIFSPMGIIAVAGPLMMQVLSSAIWSSLKDSKSVPPEVVAFLTEATTTGTYACAWFDVKMQAYAFVAAFTIGLFEFARATIKIQSHSELSISFVPGVHKGSGKIYVALGFAYFLFMGFYAAFFFVGSGMNYQLLELYKLTCNSAVIPPLSSDLTWIRFSILIPAVITYFCGIAAKNHEETSQTT